MAGRFHSLTKRVSPAKPGQSATQSVRAEAAETGREESPVSGKKIDLSCLDPATRIRAAGGKWRLTEGERDEGPENETLALAGGSIKFDAKVCRERGRMG